MHTSNLISGHFLYLKASLIIRICTSTPNMLEMHAYTHIIHILHFFPFLQKQKSTLISINTDYLPCPWTEARKQSYPQQVIICPCTDPNRPDPNEGRKLILCQEYKERNLENQALALALPHCVEPQID